MKYNHVLWVDDVPEFVFLTMSLGDRIAVERGLSSGRIIERVTFAHDLEQARERLDRPYDLIILDGDFPYAYSAEERATIDGVVQRFRARGTIERHPTAIREIGALFTELYDSHLVGIPIPIVLFSASPYNAPAAFARGLPFYTKTVQEQSSLEDLLRHRLEEHNPGESRYCVPEKRREELKVIFNEGKLEWGNCEDLLERYLLAKE